MATVEDFIPESTEDKLILLEKLKHYDKARSLDGLAMYRPHPKQSKFHHANFKFRYLRTGNRFGKSDCGAAEDCAFLIGERRWLPKNDPNRYVGIPSKANKGLLLCTDWGKVEEIFTGESQGIGQGKLWKFLPKDMVVRRDTNHNGHIHKITVKSIWGGESTLYIDVKAGFKVNSQRGESNWYDFIHVDEPIPKAMWDSYSRGLIDTDGRAWFCCTPICEPWINQFFIPSHRTILSQENENVFGNSSGVQDRVVIVGKSGDNPYVSRKGIEGYMDGLDERSKAARQFGLPIESTGLVHKDFSDEHIYYGVPYGWSSMTKPPLDYTIRYHVDCHPATPNAVLFSATAPSGQVFFFNEIWDPCDAQTLADQVKEITKDYFVANEWCDPSGFIQTMRDKTCFADDFIAYGLMLEKGSKDLLRGIETTNRMLLHRMPNKEPQLMFGNHLFRTTWEFNNYVFDDPLRRPDKPKDKDDHMMEGLHRLCVGGLNYVNQDIFDVQINSAGMHLLTL